MALSDFVLLTAEDLEPLLGRKASTIKTDARRRPQTLPPRFVLPGARRLVWLEEDVEKWLIAHKKKR